MVTDMTEKVKSKTDKNKESKKHKGGNVQASDIRYDAGMLTRIFVRLMPAAILSMIIPSLNSVIDVFVASRYIGTQAVSAIGFYTPFVSILIGISAILAGGSTIIMGRHLGTGRHKEANELFSTDIMTLLGIMSIISITVYILAPKLAGLMGAEGEMTGMTSGYIRGVAASYPATYAVTHFSSFLELEQKHTRNIVGVFAMMLSNVSLDIVLVAYFNMNTWGLGIATTAAAWINLIILVQYYFTKAAGLRFSFANYRARMLPEVIKIGFPGAVTQIYLAMRGYLMNRTLYDCAGKIGIAALSAQSSFGALEFGASYGVSVASRTLFSVFVGSRDRKSIKTVFQIAIKRIMPFGLLVAGILAALAVPFTRLFYSSASGEVYGYTISLFVIFPFAMFVSGFGLIFSAYYQCRLKMKLTNVISFVDGFAGVVISMLVLVPFCGVTGVWLSYFTSGLIVMLVVFVYTMFMRRKFPTTIDDYMLFADDFGASKEHRMSFAIHNEEEAVCCSKAVIDFCRSEQIDERHSFFSGLALEEMAAAIVQEGFKDGEKHTCVIEAANLGDRLMLRIMDDGADFEPLKRADILDESDICKNIGIRLVRSLAEKTEYATVVGLNVLTIFISIKQQHTDLV